ncbi:hypothetical protein NDU88_006345 [Pleurodeles waltl]|uniref:Uncharacterized protein n=1 Tax=Pleurodeles waltl TaxID=8319 RepID=A0AAV7RM85_PLEWA|nr:hypothetical protein NDU88_006345 [Pleurodeles waltl]
MLDAWAPRTSSLKSVAFRSTQPSVPVHSDNRDDPESVEGSAQIRHGPRPPDQSPPAATPSTLPRPVSSPFTHSGVVRGSECPTLHVGILREHLSSGSPQLTLASTRVLGGARGR